MRKGGRGKATDENILLSTTTSEVYISFGWISTLYVSFSLSVIVSVTAQHFRCSKPGISSLSVHLENHFFIVKEVHVAFLVELLQLQVNFHLLWK